MTAGEFVRRIAALGRRARIPVRFDRTRGRGATVRSITAKRFYGREGSAKECGPGLLGKMLADLGF